MKSLTQLLSQVAPPSPELDCSHRAEVGVMRDHWTRVFSVSDGRAFWFTYPAARYESRKIARFREWLCAEALRDVDAARPFVRRAVVVAA